MRLSICGKPDVHHVNNSDIGHAALSLMLLLCGMPIIVLWKITFVDCDVGSLFITWDKHPLNHILLDKDKVLCFSIILLHQIILMKNSVHNTTKLSAWPHDGLNRLSRWISDIIISKRKRLQDWFLSQDCSVHYDWNLTSGWKIILFAFCGQCKIGGNVYPYLG